MARLLMILLVVLIFLGGVMIIKYAPYTYKGLPVAVDKPLESRPFQDWREFISAIGRFKVQFPAEPQSADEELPVPDSQLVLKYNMYVSEEQGGGTFMVSLITYPEGLDTSKQENMLENVMNEMVKANPENRLRSLEFHDFQGHTALDFLIESPEVIINSRSFVVDKRLYLLTVIAKTKQYSADKFLYFINSFEFIEKAAPGPSQGEAASESHAP